MFRGSTQLPLLRHAQANPTHMHEERAYATVNGVEAYTLLSLCRHIRGTHFLPIGTFAAADASSLHIAGKEHVLCIPYQTVSSLSIP